MTIASLEGSRALSRVCARSLPRIHVLSDLHLESGPYMLPPDLECDIVVAAGDIGPVEISVPWLASLGKPVVYVFGNHEHYNTDFLEALDTAKRLAKGTQVHVLEREAVTIQGVRFLGATLWTDLFELEPGFVQKVGAFMRDYQYITAERWLARAPNRKAFEKALRAVAPKGKLQPADRSQPSQDPVRLHPLMAYVEHQRTVAWLQRSLDARGSVPTVVVSHHAPSFESLLRNGISAHALAIRRWGMFDDAPARMAGYASNLLSTKLTPRQRENIVFWVHGHTHAAMEYRDAGVHVVCNPRGRHRKPLTLESIQTSALFGARLTEDDVARSQAEFAANPWLGDGWGFEPAKVLDLARPRRVVVAKACADHLAALQTLLGDLRTWASVGGTGRGPRRAAVTFSMQTSLAEFERVLVQVRQQGLQALDGDALTVFGRLPSLPQPQLYSAQGFDAELTPADFQRALARAEQVVERVRRLPFALDLHLQAWAQQVLAAVQALEREGIRARVCALPEGAFRGVKAAEIRLVTAEKNCERAEQLVDTVVNGGAVPRRWSTWVTPAADAMLPLLSLDVVQQLAQLDAAVLCASETAEEASWFLMQGFEPPLPLA